MNATLRRLKRAVRETGALAPLDLLRYWLCRARLRPANAAFVRAHPGFALPPAALAYDAYSAPEWPFYKRSGEEEAAFVASIFKRYAVRSGPQAILDWGCGPGRIIRHLKAHFPECEITGSDYNRGSIDWCSATLPGFVWTTNELLPPLNAFSGSYDFVYGASVLTHLSAEAARAWIDEIHRVTRSGAVVVLTTHGDAFRELLLPEERARYDSGLFVDRKLGREGKRDFAAFHPVSWARGLFASNFAILAHRTGGWPTSRQDVWILRR